MRVNIKNINSKFNLAGGKSKTEKRVGKRVSISKVKRRGIEKLF